MTSSDKTALRCEQRQGWLAARCVEFGEFVGTAFVRPPGSLQPRWMTDIWVPPKAVTGLPLSLLDCYRRWVFYRDGQIIAPWKDRYELLEFLQAAYVAFKV